MFGIAVVVFMFGAPLVQEYLKSIALPTDDPIVMAGLHFRWRADGGIEIEGYLVNTASHDVRVGGTWPSVAVRLVNGSDVSPYHGLRDLVLPWQPHEARQLNYVFPSRDAPFYATVAYPHEDEENRYWRYTTPCVDVDNRPAEVCDTLSPFPPAKYRIIPQDEPRWREYLRDCCAWDIPPFDLFDTACEADGLDLVCRTSAYNFHGEPQTGSVSINVASPTGEAIASAELASALTLGANETRVLETRFVNASSQMLADAGEVTIVATAWHAAYERSKATDTSTFMWPNHLLE